MKRLNTLILALLMFALNASAQNNATLVLHHADGTTTDVELFTQPLVLFQNDSVYVTSPVADLRYAESEILRFSYKGYETGIVLPKSEKYFKQENDLLIFNGVKKNDGIALFTTDGIRVPVQLNYINGDVCLHLNALPKGVYILSVNGKTSKIIKK